MLKHRPKLKLFKHIGWIHLDDMEQVMTIKNVKGNNVHYPHRTTMGSHLGTQSTNASTDTLSSSAISQWSQSQLSEEPGMEETQSNGSTGDNELLNEDAGAVLPVCHSYIRAWAAVLIYMFSVQPVSTPARRRADSPPPYESMRRKRTKLETPMDKIANSLVNLTESIRESQPGSRAVKNGLQISPIRLQSAVDAAMKKERWMKPKYRSTLARMLGNNILEADTYKTLCQQPDDEDNNEAQIEYICDLIGMRRAEVEKETNPFSDLE
jgi:hypothetical protein